MISFRKHAPGSTRRPNTLLGRRAAATLLTLLLAASAAHAAPQRRHRPNGARAAGVKTAPRPPAQSAEGRAYEPAEEELIPVRVTRIKTPDGPAVVATIGEFPSDLNEAGREFLTRECFEQFALDVLGLEDADARATLKVALLPQEKENQREGDFTAGKLSGHMIVLVERRRVFVACTFSKAARKPMPMAAVERFPAGAEAAD